MFATFIFIIYFYIAVRVFCWDNFVYILAIFVRFSSSIYMDWRHPYILKPGDGLAGGPKRPRHPLRSSRDQLYMIWDPT